MQLIKKAIQLFFYVIYQKMRQIFWLLPGNVRMHLHGVRHSIVCWMRKNFELSYAAEGDCHDVSWTDFDSLVLKQHNRLFPILIFEPNVDWDISLFQRPQHMAMALGRQGCLVIYRTTGDNVQGFRQVAKCVWITNRQEVLSIKGAIWCFYSTSLLSSVEQMLDRKNIGKVIFEYIDHIDAAISGGKREVQRLTKNRDAAFMGSVDLIVASAKSLMLESVASRTKVPIAYIPNGVDPYHFSKITDPRESGLLQHVREFCKQYTSVVGYFGAIAPWLWYDLIRSLTDEMKDVGFIFIGPDYSGCAHKLPKNKNFIYLGAIEYNVLPLYAQCFDVAFIPFVPGSIARSTSPLKLFEYFSLQKPVVVTSAMEECVAFEEVFSGHDIPTFKQALQEGLRAGRDSFFCERLRTLAFENSWDNRATAYLEFIKKHING